jgi:hypothetical protein
MYISKNSTIKVATPISIKKKAKGIIVFPAFTIVSFYAFNALFKLFSFMFEESTKTTPIINS